MAKQSIGAFVKLKKGAEEMTTAIEYNQLDPLLRSTTFPDGDVNDPTTGYSVFPGNINQLLFKLAPYVDTLHKTKGVMGEFVNPKYTDSSKTCFKKPTRLECLMQDYVKALGTSSRTGFTTSPPWFCYSPVKNKAADAVQAVQSSGGLLPPSCAMSGLVIAPSSSLCNAFVFSVRHSCLSSPPGESDQYFLWAELMRRAGILVEPPPPEAATTALGITAQLTPRVVLLPSCCVFPCELKRVFPNPMDVCISHVSSLVLNGLVSVTSLVLDGSLRLHANEGSSLQCTFHLSDPITNFGASPAHLILDCHFV